VSVNITPAQRYIYIFRPRNFLLFSVFCAAFLNQFYYVGDYNVSNFWENFKFWSKCHWSWL